MIPMDAAERSEPLSRISAALRHGNVGGGGAPDRRAVLLAAAAALAATPDVALAAPAPLAFENGLWFDGRAFRPATMFSVDGRFTTRRPRELARTIDLRGAWIVPPFGDAHSHSFGLGRPEQERRFAASYMRDGVFYVMSQGGLPVTATERTALAINTPAGPDVAFSHATLTSHDSPLQPFTKMVVLGSGYFPSETLASLEGRRFFSVDGLEELDAKWPLVRAQRPDFIKTYLWNSEGLKLPPIFPFVRPEQRGLSEPVFRAIVRRAHADGLRVSAHVTTTGDMRLAIDAGADMLAHAPGFGALGVGELHTLVQRGIPVATTSAVAAPILEAMRAKAGAPDPLAILKALKDHGAWLVIGADRPEDTSSREAAYLRSLGWWDNAALLRLWAVETPRAIFPNRRLGRFAEGYEASFLALEGDPLVDWAATARIRLRVKQGQVLDT